mgnify:CR=1 FL=1
MQVPSAPQYGHVRVAGLIPETSWLNQLISDIFLLQSLKSGWNNRIIGLSAEKLSPRLNPSFFEGCMREIQVCGRSGGLSFFVGTGYILVWFLVQIKCRGKRHLSITIFHFFRKQSDVTNASPMIIIWCSTKTAVPSLEQPRLLFGIKL